MINVLLSIKPKKPKNEKPTNNPKAPPTSARNDSKGYTISSLFSVILRLGNNTAIPCSFGSMGTGSPTSWYSIFLHRKLHSVDEEKTFLKIYNALWMWNSTSMLSNSWTFEHFVKDGSDHLSQGKQQPTFLLILISHKLSSSSFLIYHKDSLVIWD